MRLARNGGSLDLIMACSVMERGAMFGFLGKMAINRCAFFTSLTLPLETQLVWKNIAHSECSQCPLYVCYIDYVIAFQTIHIFIVLMVKKLLFFKLVFDFCSFKCEIYGSRLVGIPAIEKSVFSLDSYLLKLVLNVNIFSVNRQTWARSCRYAANCVLQLAAPPRRSLPAPQPSSCRSTYLMSLRLVLPKQTG